MLSAWPVYLVFSFLLNLFLPGRYEVAPRTVAPLEGMLHLVKVGNRHRIFTNFVKTIIWTPPHPSYLLII